ncbi:replicative DNA helicase loader DnaB [Melghirimyces profundicolus]|uniref:Replicative DNA helicase loader DnaB n=1 Tax=Melghirimyces profundicolus TaxID=1242148 RepID=A0A2T6C4E3_9BACL|nr:DnaD domain protein [Melghirimyces profundicolus]PTX63190.1 replicative DNA helicase loader DnaB [Melghirimyces profundicolus]
MSIAWKDCTPRDGWRSRSRRPIQPTDQMVLVHLYQPLVGVAAVGLYLTIYSYLPLHRPGVSPLYSHLDLMKGLQLPLGELLQARYRLEGVGLLNTRETQEKGHRVFQYDLLAPLTPARFFQSDVLSVSLVNRLGKDRFRSLYEQWVGAEETAAFPSGGKDVTKSFQQVFGSLSPAELRSASEVEHELMPPEPVGDSDEGHPPVFSLEGEDDLSMVKARLQNILNDSAWTERVEEEVREIRFLYQLDDWDLIRAIQNPYVTQQGKIDTERLRSFVRSQYRMRFGSSPVVVDRKQLDQPGEGRPPSRTVEKGRSPVSHSRDESEEDRHFRMLNEVSPVELLKHFQKGKMIPRADLELVEDLTNHYGLPTGVINVLLEYVLYSHDYKLPRPLVEKIAGHWARKNVQTVKEAREMARKELDWEWKRRNSKGGRSRTSRNQNRRRQKEEPLPRSLAQAMEREAKGEKPGSGEVDPDTEARLRAKLNRMNQRLNQRMQEKGIEP